LDTKLEIGTSQYVHNMFAEHSGKKIIRCKRAGSLSHSWLL